MKVTTLVISAGILAACGGGTGGGASASAGDIQVLHAVAWTAPGEVKGATIGLEIRNDGDAADTLVAVTSSAGAASPAPLDVVIAGPAPTPTPEDGPLEIRDHRAWPNPVLRGRPAFVSVQLNGRADGLSLRLYTRSWVLVAESSAGPQAPGWCRVPIPAAFVDSAGSDAYYYVVSASRGGSKVLKPGKGAIQVVR